MHATSDWLTAHARFQPDAEALVDLESNRRWGYAALQQEASRWTGRLLAEGIGQGDVVAVLAPNRAETFALLFAVAELGAVLFPMNWRLTASELAWQAEHARVRLLLIDASLADRAPPRLRTLDLDDGPGAALGRGPGSKLDQPWVLLYTSGSSGRPKGALLTHQQMAWNAVNTHLACGLTSRHATLTFTPLFHTGGLNCLSTPLLHRGGRVVLARGFDAGRALRWIGEERITHLMGVPTIYQMLAEHPSFGEADLSSVEDALCGGAPLSEALLERWLDRGVPLRQGFGMTEVGPNCFSMPPAQVRRKLGSVGLPIHHLEARLLRPDGGECEPGEPGELLLRGPVVFGGYLGDPSATAASLDAEGWFHTGDVLSRDEEGYFTVCGRLKEMFISGGENVYPAEVEAVLLQAPGVGQAAVVGVPDPRWGEVGLAWLEPSPGQEVDPAEVARFAEVRLARYKLPKRYEVRAQLPRTASGKIDKPTLARER
jgi:fatty-acyl-CoA synthase